MIFSYSAIKTEILSFAIMWTDLESIMLNEISQIEKDKYYIISLIKWNLKKTQIYRKRDQTGDCLRPGQGGGEKED